MTEASNQEILGQLEPMFSVNPQLDLTRQMHTFYCRFTLYVLFGTCTVWGASGCWADCIKQTPEPCNCTLASYVFQPSTSNATRLASSAPTISVQYCLFCHWDTPCRSPEIKAAKTWTISGVHGARLRVWLHFFNWRSWSWLIGRGSEVARCLSLHSTRWTFRLS